jgi:hypothetical protein
VNIEAELVAELKRRGQEKDIRFFIVGTPPVPGPNTKLPEPLRMQLSNGEWTTWFPGHVHRTGWPA